MGNYIKNILKLILGVFLLDLAVVSCTVIKPIAVQDSTSIQYHYIDSVRYIDSTIFHHLYKEYYRDFTNLLDTLNMETSYAKSKSWVDTTNNKLIGEIQNKDDSIPEKIKWKEKIVYRDSIVYQKEEIPIPVEVIKEIHPKYEIWLWVYLVFSVLGLLVYLYFKFFVRKI